MKKIFFAFFVMFICVNVSAQFYSDYAHYYVKVGADMNENTEILIFAFDGNKMKHIKAKRSTVRANLKKNSSYYDDRFVNTRADGTYNDDLSTSSRTTYQRSEGGTIMPNNNPPTFNPITGQPNFDFSVNVVGATKYKYSFSTDKRSLIRWTSEDNRVYYKRISESEITSKDEYDFLQ